MTRPIETLRDGKLKATIWRNNNGEKAFYGIQLTSTYKDNAGNLKDSQTFHRTELLRIALLATRAYERTSVLQANSAASFTPRDGRME